MNREMNAIYLRRKNKVMLAAGNAEQPNLDCIATIIKNLESLGYTLSPDLLNNLKTQRANELVSFYNVTVETIRALLGADKVYRPMYPNFPAQVMEASCVELFINAILHYWSSGTIMPYYEAEGRPALPDFKELKVVDLGTEEDFQAIIGNLIASKTSLSDTDKEDVEAYIRESDDESIVKMLPDSIPLKENVGFVCQLILDATGLGESAMYKYIKTATDVLRLAVSMSDGDISLAKNTKFKSFKRRERRLILSLLESCNNIEEDMNRYKNVWIALGERLHPAEFGLTYGKVNKAFTKLRENVKIPTFGGTINGLITEGNVAKAVEILAKRPGELARKLDLLVRKAENPAVVVDRFSSVINDVATPVLLQVIAHFNDRQGEKSDIRTFFPKGSVAKVQSIENKLPDIDNTICATIVDLCRAALKERFSKMESLGKVYIDPKMKGCLVPFSQRSASRALKTIVRGSRVALPEDITTIRTFIYWKDVSDDYDGRTDIDLSAVYFGDDWESKGDIAYYNLRNSILKSCHSGDITAAPNGASEFIDVDIESAIKAGGRYIVFSMNSYTRQPYKDLPECFMGWMARKDPGSGEIYEPKTVENKIDVTADTQVCIPLIIDLKTREIIWADIALKSNTGYVNNVRGNKNSIALMCEAIATLKKHNLYDLFMLHAEARGELVENKEDADTVFSLTEGVTPFDTDIIMAQYI